MKYLHNIIWLFIIADSCFAHPIFTSDEILEAVAKSNHFPDSKTFLDLILKVPVPQALQKFKSQEISNWIQDNFLQANYILQQTSLPDFKESPATFDIIKKPELLAYAQDLNQRWIDLSRKVNLRYKEGCSDDCSSFIPEINNKIIIIPGGRFKEAYYWDTYWIIKGLIASDMLYSAQLLIDNFIIMIKSYGFIPNGFRIYYLNRSQPPFFGLMVRDLAQAYRKKGMESKAEQIQQKAFPHLVAEHQYFMSTHSIDYKTKSQQVITLNKYNANTSKPRPQSYREDLNLVNGVTGDERARILKGISSMAESGWDFSSRWLKDASDLKSTIINEMIPSDLNTILGLVEEYLIPIAPKFGRGDLVWEYRKLLEGRKQYFLEIFNGNTFPDHQHQKTYPSDFYPYLLFPERKPEISQLYKDQVNPVSSFVANGQQWDSPNVWAPNNWILHEVVSNDQAFKLAQQWVSTTYCSWKKTKLIYEKYRNDRLGERGKGGEYEVQTGFGWTNGLCLYYLALYGDKLEVPDCS